MAQLIIRKLDEELVRWLKLRAVRHGRSMEAEHRAILESALLEDEAEDFKNWLLSLAEADVDLPLVRDPGDKGRNVDGFFT